MAWGISAFVSAFVAQLGVSLITLATFSVGFTSIPSGCAYARRMSDGSDSPFRSSVLTAAPSGLVGGLKTFAASHGGATAVIEYVGRKGARIVLVGQDGTWGDQFADSTDLARAACEKAGVAVENEWERELTEQMRPSNDLWRSMGRRVFSR